MDDAHRPHQRATLDGYGDQAALFDVVTQNMHRQDADAAAQNDGLFHGLGVVEVHDDVHLDTGLAQIAFHFAAHAEIVVESHEVLLRQVARDQLRLGRQGMRRGGRNHHLVLAPGNRGDLAVRFGVAHQPKVGLVREHCLVDLLGPQVLHQQLRFRHTAGHLPLEPGHVGDSDGVDRRNPHGALDQAFEFVQLSVEFLLAAQHVAAELEVQAPGFGQFERPRSAVQQLDPQQALGLLQLLGGGGLAHAAALGCAGHASGKSHFPEKFEVV